MSSRSLSSSPSFLSSSFSTPPSTPPSVRSTPSSVVPAPEQQISLGKIYLNIETLQPNKYTYFDDNKSEVPIENLLDITELPIDIFRIELNKLFTGQGSNNDAQCQEEKEYLLKAIEYNTKKINQVLSYPVVSHEPSDVGHYEIG